MASERLERIGDATPSLGSAGALRNRGDPIHSSKVLERAVSAIYVDSPDLNVGDPDG